MSDHPVISIIIVSWNVRSLLAACIESIKRHLTLSYEIIVVDNASSDDTIKTLEQNFPDVKLIKNDRNLGFARANNQGWQASAGQYCLFLNPDTELIDNSLAKGIEYLASHSDVGCLGPELLNADHSHQSSVRRFPTLADQSAVLLKLRHWQNKIPAVKKYLQEPAATDAQPVKVDQVMGAAMLIPKTVLAMNGSFDEGYWIWFEEVDLQKRMIKQGYEVLYWPAVKIIHHGGSSFAQVMSVRKQYWFTRSLARYAKKYWPTRDYYALQALIPISWLLALFQSIIKSK